MAPREPAAGPDDPYGCPVARLALHPLTEPLEAIADEFGNGSGCRMLDLLGDPSTTRAFAALGLRAFANRHRADACADAAMLDPTRLPFRDSSFDLISVAAAGRATASIRMLLDEAHRVVTSGGTLLLCDDPLVDAGREPLPETHPFATAAGWCRLVEEHGFRVEVTVAPAITAANPTASLHVRVSETGPAPAPRQAALGNLAWGGAFVRARRL